MRDREQLTETRHPRARLFIIRALQIWIGVAVLYFVGLNVLLMTPLLRRVASQGRDFELTYSRAYSIVPGRIHVEGLTLRGTDTHVEWFVAVDSATFGTDVLAVVHRRFHATFVKANGVAVRIRMLESAPDPEHDAHVPPIPGFAIPALRPIGPPVTVTDANYDLVSVDLENVEAHDVREIWVDTLALTGNLDVHGRWLFQPVRRLEVGPAAVDVRDLVVANGPDRAILAGVHGHVDATIEPFDLRRPIREILKALSVSTDLAGTMRGPELSKILPLPGGGAITAGEGELTIHARARRGALEVGSTWGLEIPAVRARAFGLEAQAAATVAGHVADDSGRPFATVSASLRALEVEARGEAAARAELVQGSLMTPYVDFNGDPYDLRYDVSLQGLQAARLDPWLRVLALDANLRGETLVGGGQWAGSLTDHSGSGSITVAASGLSYSVSHTEASGDVHVAATASLSGQRAAGSLELRVPSAQVRTSAQAFSGAVTSQASSWSADWSERNPVIQTGPIHVDLRDVQAMTVAPASSAVTTRVSEVTASTENITFGAGSPQGRVAFDAERIDLLSVVQLAHLLPPVRWLHVDGGSGTASAHGSLDVSRALVTGEARIGLRSLEVHVGGKHLLGDAYVAVSARTTGPSYMDLAGSSVSVQHLAGAGDKDWWARASVVRGGVSAKDGSLTTRANVSLEARDARPVDAMVSSISGVPNWVLGIFSLPELKLRSELTIASHHVAIHDLDANGGSTHVQLELVSDENEMRGLVFARHGVLEVGLGLGKETPHVVLLNVHDWFEARKSALDEISAGRRPLVRDAAGSGSTDLAALLQPASP